MLSPISDILIKFEKSGTHLIVIICLEACHFDILAQIIILLLHTTRIFIRALYHYGCLTIIHSARLYVHVFLVLVLIPMGIV